MFTNEQQFQFTDGKNRVLIHSANGFGEVNLYVKSGEEWMQVENLIGDGVLPLAYGTAVIRVNPVGGATFDIK